MKNHRCMSSQLPLLPFDSLEWVACQFLVFVTCVCHEFHLNSDSCFPSFHASFLMNVLLCRTRTISQTSLASMAQLKLVIQSPRDVCHSSAILTFCFPVNMPMDRRSGFIKGYSFVEYETKQVIFRSEFLFIDVRH